MKEESRESGPDNGHSSVITTRQLAQEYLNFGNPEEGPDRAKDLVRIANKLKSYGLDAENQTTKELVDVFYQGILEENERSQIRIVESYGAFSDLWAINRVGLLNFGNVRDQAKKRGRYDKIKHEVP